jgi:ATP-dependent Clp protease ATP-binding subunit ClpA
MLGNVPYTPRGKKVLLLAAKEAQALNHTYVGTEHLLLGLLREGDGVAARVLKDLEVDIEKTRQEILRELDPNFPGTLKGVEPLTSDLPPVPARTATLPNAESAKPQPELIDISKRYDVYCAEREQEVVVYRNALFKGVRALFPENRNDLFSQFVQIEQADSQTVFIAKYSIIKFCKPGATPD